jgi:hypothetical protein
VYFTAGACTQNVTIPNVEPLILTQHFGKLTARIFLCLVSLEYAMLRSLNWQIR